MYHTALGSPPPAVSPDALSPLMPLIRDGVRGFLPRSPLPLYEMIRYHLGVDGEGGGKALRPALCLLACAGLGGTAEAALPAATAVEYVHSFSLVHDDIEDGDVERRGRPAVWARWGVAQGINAGDALFALAFRVLASAPLPSSRIARAVDVLARRTLEMIEGQHLDLAFEARPAVSLDDYCAMVAGKTGALLACSLELGAVCAGAGEDVVGLLESAGRNLGLAFQVTDDCLGLWGDRRRTGKAVGADVLRRKKTFPVVWALASANGRSRAQLASAYERPSLTDGDLAWVARLLDEVGAREAASAFVGARLAEAAAALDRAQLAPEARAALGQVLEYVARRDK